MITTTDLSKFGWREREILERILKAWREYGLPENFYDDGVVPMFNTGSGFVFLTNSDCQVAMLNDDKLQIWHHCAYCGHEAFLTEFGHVPHDENCIEQMEAVGIPENEIKELKAAMPKGN